MMSTNGRWPESLDSTVEDCVNAVGVDVNTASVALLARVSGLNQALAENIVDHRDAKGPFRGSPDDSDRAARGR